MIHSCLAKLLNMNQSAGRKITELPAKHCRLKRLARRHLGENIYLQVLPKKKELNTFYATMKNLLN